MKCYLRLSKHLGEIFHVNPCRKKSTAYLTVIEDHFLNSFGETSDDSRAEVSTEGSSFDSRTFLHPRILSIGVYTVVHCD